jgi:hypothetical protein
MSADIAFILRLDLGNWLCSGLGFGLGCSVRLRFKPGLRMWCRGGTRAGRRGGHGGAHASVMGGHGLVHRLGHVVPDMPPVGDLGRLGRTLAGAFGVGAGPVSADGLHLRVLAQPCGQRLTVAARKDLDRPVGVHVQQHRAIHVPAVEREVIDAEHADLPNLRVGHGAQQVEQRIPADWHTQRVGQPGTGSTGQRNRDRGQRHSQWWGVAGVGRGQRGDLWGEGGPAATRFGADKSVYL